VERFADDLDLTQLHIDKHINAAVSKIREKATEGKGRKECCECGIEIPSARLKLIPNAERCATCQEHHEQHERLFAAPPRYSWVDDVA